MNISSPVFKKRLRITTVVVVLVALVVYALTFVVKSLNEGREVPVLMYHSIADNVAGDVWSVFPDEFESQMRDLKNDGRVAILPYHLYLASRGLFLLPEKPVVITFDDGFRNNVDTAEPIMAKYGMRGICYLILSHIGDSEETRSQYRNRDNLIWPDVRAAMKRGVLSFGIHSISHTPQLSRQAKEVARARRIFHAKTGRKTNSYCYPNGRTDDNLVSFVKSKNRYKTAMICEDQMFVFSKNADFYRIPRVSVYGGKHTFAIAEVLRNGDFLSVSMSHDVPLITVKTVLHDKVNDVFYQPSCGNVRLAGVNTVLLGWSGLPENSKLTDFEVLVQEQNGLFTYSKLPLD